MHVQVGLGVACDYALQQGMQGVWQSVQHRSGMLRSGLRNLPGVQLRDVGDTLCGIVSFSVVRLFHSRVEARSSTGPWCRSQSPVGWSYLKYENDSPKPRNIFYLRVTSCRTLVVVK